MSETPFTIVDQDRTCEVEATLESGRVLLSDGALRQALGFERKPEGLCRGEICIPTASDARLGSSGRVDLAALAERLDRPLALDLEQHAAVLGESARERSQALLGGVAPDFTLPDLAGRPVSLSGFRGKKVLLIAYASW